MPVLRTDEWLMKTGENPVALCKKLVPYFNDASAHEIFLHLTRHGMYRSANGLKEIVEKMKEKNIWEYVNKKYSELRKRWNGPDIPIFIFPADWKNRRIQREFNGKSGLAFKDKLFLFLLPHHQKEEIQAVLTHEYNHVCRLNKYTKEEEQYTLLDSIILEGLAENAVGEVVGGEYQASWTNYYPEERAYEFWKRFLYENRNVKKEHPLHQQLLYGSMFYPKMLGYFVGYHIVKSYLRKSSIYEAMACSSEEIFRDSSFQKHLS
jgi:uncharacterized protein YjaZ